VSEAAAKFTEYRTGLGWDVHRITGGRKLMLGGVEIPWSYGLEGHSDADILLHAVTDAVLGAAALGDIGEHFPNTNPEWKNAASRRFLEEAIILVEQEGYSLVHIDSTVILETPKLKEHRAAIRESLASIAGLPLSSVSVKFKTAEAVGPVGRGLSAEAQAAVTIGR